MAISLDYVLRETATNIRGNILMTTAAIITVAVSLAIVGTALLVRQGVANATIQWRGGVELSIFLNPEIAETQRESILAQLEAMPEVRRVIFVDQDSAYEEFRTMFANSPDMVDSVTASDLPPSYRIVPRQPEFIRAIGERFQATEGVREVVYAEEMVNTLINVTDAARRVMFALALVLGVAAILLILNTIRMAIFARRREVAVMKLVGATNSFIRVPFMLEGMVHGLVGAGAAFAVLFIGRGLLESRVRENELFYQFVVSSSEVMGTGILILVVGTLVGMVGSAIAVSRFLDV
jgi:cell division transport system permease protein